MSEIIYKPLIEDMTWSFSRVESFDMCHYKWFLKYIRGWMEDDLFYASYGSFMHEILRLYYDGELKKEEMLTYFLSKFKTSVAGERPRESTVKKYIKSGVDYLTNFKPFPFNTVAVEKKVCFEIEGYPFIGYIDYLGEKDGGFYIVDHKSRELKPRSGRNPPTVKDLELDELLKQLYIYGESVKKEFGEYPRGVALNCFRNGVFIQEPFDLDKFDAAKKWAVDMIKKIENEEDFAHNRDSFACKWLCGLHDKCIYDLEAKEEWRQEKLHAG